MLTILLVIAIILIYLLGPALLEKLLWSRVKIEVDNEQNKENVLFEQEINQSYNDEYFDSIKKDYIEENKD